MAKINVTIDGPSGSGKSTIAQKFAQETGLSFLNSGTIYRIIAYFFQAEKVKQTVLEIKKNLRKINIVYDNNIFLLDGINLEDQIRNPEITKLASKLAQNEAVRTFATDLQRKIVNKGGFVLEGRDAGTNVLPNAGLKFWLTASLEERAMRRYNQFKSQGIPNLTYDTTYQDLQNRDKLDESRDLNPLKLSFDMIVVDTSQLTIPEVLDKLKISYFAVIRHPFRINKNFTGG